MNNYYRIWDANLGQKAGFSAYLVRVLGQLHRLNESFNLEEIKDKIWIDWVQWSDVSGWNYNYHEGDLLPQKNSWDYYFENKVDSDYAIKSINENLDNWYSTDGSYHGYPPPQNFLWGDNNLVSKMGFFCENFLVPKKEILNELKNEVLNHKTLGAHCRRSDLHWAHGNLQLSFSEEDYFRNVMKVFEHGKFEKIYLSTEEISIYNYFMERVPEIIISYPDFYRVIQTESPVFNLHKNVRPLHKYLTGKEILIEILNLSRCHSLVCYISGVSAMATYYNNCKFDKIYYHNNLSQNIL